MLTIGRLRGACALRGIRELTVAKSVARISPVDLPASKTVRLQRLYPKAVYKAELRQLVVPVPAGKGPEHSPAGCLPGRLAGWIRLAATAAAVSAFRPGTPGSLA